MKTRDLIKEEGRQEGIQKGLEEGRQKGREEGLEEGIQKGLEEGRQKERRQFVFNMLLNNVDTALICKVTGLSKEEIKKLQT